MDVSTNEAALSKSGVISYKRSVHPIALLYLHVNCPGRQRLNQDLLREHDCKLYILDNDDDG
jgi:hypothetical protein